MRRVALAALLTTIALAGCMTAPPSGNADSKAFSCPTGQFVSGFDADGRPVCHPYPTLAGSLCPEGQSVVGFDGSGMPKCAAPSSPMPPASPTQEVRSGLQVSGIYGARQNVSDTGLWDIKVNVELARGSTPLDATKLILRYANATATTNYRFDGHAFADGLGPRDSFSVTWIRGTGTNAIMQPGDLVEVHFNMNNEGPHRLGTRTSVYLSLIPETGNPISADFKTPTTYGSDLVITLR
jgi:hypothetical protein